MRFAVLVLLAACAGRQQEAKWGVRGESQCPTDRGCELAPTAEDYRGPDDKWQPETVDDVLAERAHEVTCAQVGTAMASLELGNYAEADELAPIAKRHERSCIEARLTRDERTCVYESRDRATMSYCASRLFPEAEIQIVPPRECESITTALRRRLDDLPGSKKGAWNKAVAALDESCRNDRWTRQVADCHRSATGPGSCVWTAPEPLRVKMVDRLHKAGVIY
jgi:hypothetical protein